QIEATETRAEQYLATDAELVIVAYGASSRIARSAIDTARMHGIKAGMLRPITLWPFPIKEIQAATANAKNILVVEMSMGQMVNDVKLAVECKLPVHFFGRTGGVIPTPAEVLQQIKRISAGGAA
ncbi:MAG: transketolase C-terminal domain-containing protein, partial [Sporomusa sp.]